MTKDTILFAGRFSDSRAQNISFSKFILVFIKSGSVKEKG